MTNENDENDGPDWNDYTRFIQAFLVDHPEHEDDCAWLGEPPELCMKVSALQAFMRWALVQGMVPEDRVPTAYATLSRLKDMENREV